MIAVETALVFMVFVLKIAISMLGVSDIIKTIAMQG